jgi:predicted NAD/FAD-dependent oxidoreductase
MGKASVAIIGAGMAGVAAAARLGAAGWRCTLFDKGRGVGGRMATRRAGDFVFDHGAQFVTARGPRFAAMLAGWTASGHAAPWFADAHVGMPGMSAMAKALLGDTPLQGGCEVTGLRRDGAGWTVYAAAGPVAVAGNGSFDWVVLAAPAPQAAKLVASAGATLPGLGDVVYAPCWALMLGFDGPSGLAADQIRRDAGAIAWVARNASKPGRDPAREAVVAHASPSWSRTWLEHAPETVAPALCAALREAHGVTADPRFMAAHRWRYALVERAAGAPCLLDAGSRLGACGDWCLGPRVEAAFDSGEAMADALLAA